MGILRVYIVADVEVVDAHEGFNSFVVADALAQTLGGECGEITFGADDIVDGEDVPGTFRLRNIGAAAGKCADAAHQMYPVKALRNGGLGILPVRADS